MHDSLKKCGNVQVGRGWPRLTWTLRLVPLFSRAAFSFTPCTFHQTHLRLREATHRLTAEFINGRVQVRAGRPVDAPRQRRGPPSVHSALTAPSPLLPRSFALLRSSLPSRRSCSCASAFSRSTTCGHSSQRNPTGEDGDPEGRAAPCRCGWLARSPRPLPCTPPPPAFKCLVSPL